MSSTAGRCYLALALLACVAAVLQAAAVSNNVADDPNPKDWWETTVFYQVYPRSFKDSDGDGIGDLNGITENMDHFVDAGVGAIWLSPIFQSPMVDFGYDISDFREVHKEYGTMKDFENLIAKAKKLGLKVVLDFHHASDQSEYFKLSVNRTEGYEDFFIWEDGKLNPTDNKTLLPPNNWGSLFQGLAWTWNEQRGQYYLHQFAVQQPDFNYRNPAVLDELKSVMTFWLDKGVDGFRIDAVPHLVEADKKNHGGVYPDNPLSGISGLGPLDMGYTIQLYTKDQPESYDIIYQWRKLLDDYSKKDGSTRVMMTEAYTNVSMTMLYYGNNSREGSHIPFNFDFIIDLNGKSTARDIAYVSSRWLTYMPSGRTPNWVFGNHDNPRLASRFGSHMVDGLNMLDLLLPGVAIVWQGDELGMENGNVSWADTVDVSGCSAGEDRYREFSRDPARTPFQWDNSTNAGFSTASKTWLPVASDYLRINLKNEKAAAKSHFKVFQDLTAIRKHYAAIQKGDMTIKALSDNIFALTRSLENEVVISLVVNMGPQAVADLSQFSELSDVLHVAISSVNSTRSVNDTVNANSIKLDKGEALVMVSPPVPRNCYTNEQSSNE